MVSPAGRKLVDSVKHLNTVIVEATNDWEWYCPHCGVTWYDRGLADVHREEVAPGGTLPMDMEGDCERER